MEQEKLDELYDLKNDYVVKITNRCIELFPSKWEGVSKDILYNHNEDEWVHDAVLSDLLSELKQIEKSIQVVNPFDAWVDEFS